ncbi:hypothetical protein BDV95DRAFT_610720 [Massariosphaeria phaeospora]|uniref:GST N-terminal domain-containing protein n=1 Tax=Massariosphaeria phaeospora TaxID=100035 RepID=A0A7C8I267_9PLEO|nr:hypothetical protein BDV95DRAFT_610720 [Massariosphaeria phaeospora]
MSGSPCSTKTTIWLWPTGLYPRRLIYYLRAKCITLSTLATHNIHLIPVTFVPTPALVSKPGYEARPKGTSVPCLRIERSGQEPRFVYESMAIMEYLDEVLGGGNAFGETVEQRARTRDILSLLADAAAFQGVALIHSDKTTLSWSGIESEDAMSASAAIHATGRFHDLLCKLERWVEEDVIRKEMQSLSGEGAGATMADFVLMTAIMYFEDSYGKDWVEEHGVLRLWCERAKGQAWFAGKELLQKCEDEGWGAVLEE